MQYFTGRLVPVLPVLYLIACGGRPAGQLSEFVRFAQEQGWDVCVIATPDGTKFLDAAYLAELTGHPVRSQYKDPAEPDVLPPANAFVVAPATFNTINMPSRRSASANWPRTSTRSSG